MTKLILKTAAILAVTEFATMFLLRYAGLSGHPLVTALDPLFMLLLALGPIYLLMRAENAKLKKREALDHLLHSIVNNLWSASLQTLSIDVLLESILKEIIDRSPISILRKGAIFLKEAGELRLKTSIGYSEEQKSLCGVVPRGKCLCGSVLETGGTIYSADVDERHSLRPRGMAPHGHYCLPIKSAEKVIGVLTIYLAPGHKRDTAEENFLMSVCAIIARIVEGKKLERTLLQMQKTEALNRFAAGIAHDFNNVLGAIRGYCAITAHTLPRGSQAASDIGDICGAVDRGEALTRQLKLFSSQSKETPETFDLNPEIEKFGQMIRRIMGPDIGVQLVLSSSPLQVKGSRGQLEQLVMNLAVNARDAMPAGGEFTLTTCRIDSPLPSVKCSFPAVCITAEDTGEGMNEEVLKNIFEPFFTTKPEGKGSGLGLSITQTVVQQHGGDIAVRSAPGKGARFDIYLPLAVTPRPG